jgi:hypothetical protein
MFDTSATPGERNPEGRERFQVYDATVDFAAVVVWNEQRFTAHEEASQDAVRGHTNLLQVPYIGRLSSVLIPLALQVID